MNSLDVEDLARVVCGLPDDASEDEIDEALEEKHMLTFDAFERAVHALIKYTIPANAALTGKVYQGFVKDGAFICKQPFDA